MKVLYNKKIDEILKRVVACQIIANKYIKDADAFDCMTRNLVGISFEVGDIIGTKKVMNTLKHRYENE